MLASDVSVAISAEVKKGLLCERVAAGSGQVVTVRKVPQLDKPVASSGADVGIKVESAEGVVVFNSTTVNPVPGSEPTVVSLGSFSSGTDVVEDSEYEIVEIRTSVVVIGISPVVNGKFEVVAVVLNVIDALTGSCLDVACKPLYIGYRSVAFGETTE